MNPKYSNSWHSDTVTQMQVELITTSDDWLHQSRPSHTWSRTNSFRMPFWPPLYHVQD